MTTLPINDLQPQLAANRRFWCGWDGADPSTDLVTDSELAFAFPSVIRLGGYIDGRIVGTCTLSLGAEVGALYCIAVNPSDRRRGIGTASTQEALRLPKESGRRIATLQASAEGELLYRKMGFKTISRYRLYSF